MTLAHARALISGEPWVAPFDPQHDDKALRALAVWAIRFSPLVTPDPPDGLLLDITGCQRLFRGERRLMYQLDQSVARLGFGTRVATAPTFGCAWAAARFGPYARTLVPAKHVRDTLAALPVQALRLEPDTIAALDEVGIDHVAHLLQLPRRQLSARFGSELLLRLDQAMGEAIETLDPVRPVAPPSVERVFPGPVKQIEAVEQTVRELLSELVAELQQRESGIRRLDVMMERIDTHAERFTVTLSHPSRQAEHLWKLLRPRTEKVNLGYGVERIELSAPRVGPLPHTQSAPWADEDTPGAPGTPNTSDTMSAAGELIDVLSNRLGSQRVLGVDVQATHIPERTFDYHPAVVESAGQRHHAPPAVVDADRPSRLLDRPEPIHVIATTPDGPPSWLRWGRHERHILHALGPERISPEWWRQHVPDASDSVPSPTRDYFKIGDDTGQWLWVFHELETGRWFLHGLWA